MRTLFIYLFKKALLQAMAVFLLLLLLYITSDFAESAPYILDRKDSVGTFILYYGAQIPLASIYIIPVALCLLPYVYINSLLRRNELIACTISGYSTLQTMLPAILTLLIAALIYLQLFSGLGIIKSESRRLRQKIRSNEPLIFNDSWLILNNRIFEIEGFSESRASRIRIFRIEGSHISRYTLYENVDKGKETRAKEDLLFTDKKIYWSKSVPPSRLDPERLVKLANSPTLLSNKNLYEAIQQCGKNCRRNSLMLEGYLRICLLLVVIPGALFAAFLSTRLGSVRFSTTLFVGCMNLLGYYLIFLFTYITGLADRLTHLVASFVS